jgi:4-aminobutyrate aminotransferase-like enzyme
MKTSRPPRSSLRVRARPATITGAGFIRLAPPIVTTPELFVRALDILDDAVSAVEKRFAVG